MNFLRILKIGLLLIALGVLGLFMLFERYEPVSAITLSNRPNNQNSRPIGEITTDFRAEQLIVVSSILGRRQMSYDDDVCIELLMANWSNRQNTGDFAVDVITAGETFTQVIDAASVKDNANRRICFDDLQFRKLVDNDEIRLVLRGISSPAGAAITAWTTTDLSAGRLINAPEQLASRSFIFHFVSERYSASSYRHAWIIVFFGMLAIATVFFPSSVGDRQEPLTSRSDEE
ncbi:hypothetical protein OE810_04645 [Rhodobacteraceae bacterium XHP0102]|nr:hypothetical protein [Rhodobacteraceae bacterium XHP0102]